MTDDAEALTEREFKRWLPVAEAIERCAPRLSSLTAARSIWGRLETADIKAAAASVTRPHRSNTKFFLVPPGWWRQQAALSNLDFWKTGDIDIAVSSGVYGEPDRTVGRLRGVRFDPAGIAEVAPAPSPSVETAATTPHLPTAIEFQHWLRPADALVLLPEGWGRGHGVAAIKTALRIGGVRAVAQRGLLGGDRNQQSVELYAIAPEFWDEDRWLMGSEALWVTGQVSFHRGSRLAERLGHQPEEWIEHTFTGVCFDPADFSRELPISLAQKAGGELGLREPDSDDRDKPRLPDALLKQWHALFALAYPDGAIELARQSVAGMFPRHHASRDRVRELFPNRAPGRPRKNKDSS